MARLWSYVRGFRVADLVQFLRARIDEDEAAALAAGAGPHSCSAYHGAPADAFRWLAECAAKRRIIELHMPGHECSVYEYSEKFGRWVDTCHYVHEFEVCSTLKLLASVYADHPDFDPDWLQP